MQFLAQILSKLLFCLGIMITVVSCVVGSAIGSGADIPFTGIALIIIGAVLWRKTSKKSCPACSEHVKHQARKCQHCGADITS